MTPAGAALGVPMLEGLWANRKSPGQLAGLGGGSRKLVSVVTDERHMRSREGLLKVGDLEEVGKLLGMSH